MKDKKDKHEESGCAAKETEKNGQEVVLEEKLNELDILKQSLDEKRLEAEKYYEQLLRLKAEFDNYRKRVEKDMSEMARHGKTEVIESIFPVLDSFDKAIPAIKDSGGSKAILDGVNMIHKHLSGVLEKNGLKRIESSGKPFDPGFHHAVMTRDCAKADENRVLEEVQAGYMLGERVIRPAMVVVGKHEGEQEKQEDKGEEEK